jgi:hypothetical protein
VRLSIGTANNDVGIYQSVALSASTQYTLQFYRKVSSTSGSPNLVYYIRNTSNGKFLQVSGTWSSTYNTFSVVPTTSWGVTSKTFTSDTAANYEIGFAKGTVNSAGKNFYLDNATLV